MNTLDNLKLSGKLNITLTDANGGLKDQRQVDNLVVSSGIAFIASRMKDATTAAMTHMAVGSGTTAASSGDTDLGTLIGSRIALTSTTANSTNVVYSASFAAGVSTGAITEAGIFNASTSGTMLCRTTFPVINKAAGDTMTITWTITLTATA